MIKEKEITINGHSSNYKYYQNLGYDVKVRKPFNVKTEDLMKGSVVKVTTICDSCSKESSNVFKDYYNYTNGFTEPYYCKCCKVIKSKETSKEKWGVDNPMKSDEVKEILKKSLMDKYGVDHYSKTDEYKIKFKETCLSKYNVDNPYKSEDIKKKIKETTLKNTGYEHASKSPKNKKAIKKHRQRLTWSKYDDLIGDNYNVINMTQKFLI